MAQWRQCMQLFFASLTAATSSKSANDKYDSTSQLDSCRGGKRQARQRHRNKQHVGRKQCRLLRATVGFTKVYLNRNNQGCFKGLQRESASNGARAVRSRRAH